MKQAFQIHARDNVATLLEAVEAGETVRVVGAHAGTVRVREAIEGEHKVALAEIAEGAPVLKFGTRIGTALRAIGEGEWVHLHNLRSDYDERSGGFDPSTGVPEDTHDAYV
jgi:altronate dehydratase small subunit